MKLIKEHKRQRQYRHTKLLEQLNDLIEHLINERRSILKQISSDEDLGNLDKYLPKRLANNVYLRYPEELFMDCYHDGRVPTIKEITESVLGGIIT